MNDYAAAANRAGAYAIVVDSFGSRGMDFRSAVRMTCSGLRLRGPARAGDILAAEELARRHWSNVDFSGVILAGWSHGGWSVMELLSAGPGAARIGNFRIDRPAPRALAPDAVALFYPYCGFLNSTARSRWDFEGPLFLLLAGINSGPPGQCTSAIEHARGGGDKIEVVTFENVTPAFDEDDHGPTSNYRWDPEAAARAHALFERFIADQKARLE
jgi:dienelactone hydrolase